MVDIARAALHFSATAGNFCDHGVIIGELGPMIVLQPGADPAELQVDDLAHDVVGDRIIRHHDQPAQKRRLEDLEQIRTQGLRQRLWVGARLRIGTELHDRVRADVGGQQNHACS